MQIPESLSNYALILNEGEFLQGYSNKKELKRHFEHISKAFIDGKPLAVHFHGGLVSEEDGIMSAKYLKPVFENAGAYPYFIIWRSSLGEMFLNKLRAISELPLFKPILNLLVNFTCAKSKEEKGTKGGLLSLYPSALISSEVAKYNQGVQSILDDQENDIIGEFSNVQIDQFNRIVSMDDSLKKAYSEIEEIEEGAKGGGAMIALIGGVTLAMLRRRAVETLKNIGLRFYRGTDHGKYLTIIEEMFNGIYLDKLAGKPIWKNLKENTENAFQEDPEKFGGTALLLELKKHWKKDHPPRVILSGHSTGAFQVCHMLKYADLYDLPAELKFDIFLLAPACTFDFFAHSLHYRHRINNIRIFNLKDIWEIDDRMMPRVFPASVLYAVAGLLEEKTDEPVLGMERYFEERKSYSERDKRNFEFIKKILKEKIVWSVSNNGDGRKNRAQTHAGLMKDDWTLESIQFLIKNGFSNE